MSLKVGESVPDFSLVADNGKPFKLSSKIKSNALLVFYPGDGTPVCTKQFLELRDNASKFADLNVEIIGISGNDTDSHKSFKKDHNLPFTLLSDSDAKVSKEFDCYGWFGTKRGVFLITKDLELKYSRIESVSIFTRTAEELVESIKKHT
ncbi:MAG: peroxiredoxin [Marinicellaceae bacterium]